MINTLMIFTISLDEKWYSLVKKRTYFNIGYPVDISFLNEAAEVLKIEFQLNICFICYVCWLK